VSKRAAQARTPERAPGRAARDRLLAAGVELLGERGADGFSVAELSRRSGLSNGSIYWLMPSKEILLAAIHEHHLAVVEAAAQERSAPEMWAGLDLDRTLRKAVGDLIGVFDRNAAVLRASFARAAVDPAWRARGTRQMERAHGRFVDALALVADEITHPQPGAAIDFCFRVTMATLRQNVSVPIETDMIAIDRDGQIVELTAMFRAYLTPAVESG
jgi:AcrR family transcriptional regulator